MVPLNDRVFSYITIKIAEKKIQISDIMKEELNRFWEMSRNGHIQNDG